MPDQDPVFDTPWADISDQLAETYKDKYFYRQEYHEDNGNFLAGSVPVYGFTDKKFFGPKMLNICIVSDPLGWKQNNETSHYDFDWPPTGWAEAVAYMDRNSSRWANYRLIWFIDLYTAGRIKAKFPDSDFLYMMKRTGTKIQIESQNSPWQLFGGMITSQVEPNFFTQYIDAFYAGTLDALLAK